MNNQGIPDQMFDGRPVIGICTTFSEQVVRKLATADRMLGKGKDVADVPAAGNHASRYPSDLLGDRENRAARTSISRRWQRPHSHSRDAVVVDLRRNRLDQCALRGRCVAPPAGRLPAVNR
jgi:hypothetical protein